jgi:hypothetical protein
MGKAARLKRDRRSADDAAFDAARAAGPIVPAVHCDCECGCLADSDVRPGVRFALATGEPGGWFCMECACTCLDI